MITTLPFSNGRTCWHKAAHYWPDKHDDGEVSETLYCYDNTLEGRTLGIDSSHRTMHIREHSQAFLFCSFFFFRLGSKVALLVCLGKEEQRKSMFCVQFANHTIFDFGCSDWAVLGCTPSKDGGYAGLANNGRQLFFFCLLVSAHSRCFARTSDHSLSTQANGLD